MAKYMEAIAWIASNDSAGDTEGLSYAAAFADVYGLVTVALVTDVFEKRQARVAQDVLRARGIRKPKGWRAPPESAS